MASVDLAEAVEHFDRAVQQRDRALAEQVLDADHALVVTEPSVGVMPRDQWLGTLHAYVVHDWSVQQRRIEVDGDTAVVLTRLHMRATVLGQDRSGPFVMTDVWRLRPAGWRVWRRHSTPASAGAMPT